MQIRILQRNWMRIHADQDPQASKWPTHFRISYSVMFGCFLKQDCWVVFRNVWGVETPTVFSFRNLVGCGVSVELYHWLRFFCTHTWWKMGSHIFSIYSSPLLGEYISVYVLQNFTFTLIDSSYTRIKYWQTNIAYARIEYCTHLSRLLKVDWIWILRW